MDEGAKKEVESLKLMARNWARGYEKVWVAGDGDREVAYTEFMEEIVGHLIPYANRLVETGTLTPQEASELTTYFVVAANKLREGDSWVDM